LTDSRVSGGGRLRKAKTGVAMIPRLGFEDAGFRHLIMAAFVIRLPIGY
jgi:hypothetical protein